MSESVHTTTDEVHATTHGVGDAAEGAPVSSGVAIAHDVVAREVAAHEDAAYEHAVAEPVPAQPEVPLGPPISPLVRGSSSDRTLAKHVEEEESLPASSHDFADEADEGDTVVVSRSKSSDAAGGKKRSAGRSKAAAEVEPSGEPVEKSADMKWYILKVQSNREESIREGLMRRVAIQGLGRFFGDVIVPTEKVTEFKGGKKRVIKRKLYPGYIVVNMEINEETWFLVRETTGIGDFTGASGHPTPMLEHEVDKIVAKQEEKSEKAPKLKIAFNAGERVKVNEGTFENFEGDVESIDETNGKVTVMINIFGRSTPVELEYWQVEVV